MKKKHLIPLCMGLMAGIIVSAFYYYGVLDGLELKSYDFRFKLRGPVAPSINPSLVEEFNDEKKEFSDNIVIVAVDEESVAAFGRWPWSRNYHFRLIETLERLGAKLIVFDVLFSEHDKNLPFFDLELAKITQKYNNKVMYANYIEYVTAPVVEGNKIINKQTAQLLNPYPELDLATMHKGFANADPDNDGVLRKAILRLNVNGVINYSLDVVAAALFKNISCDKLIEGHIKGNHNIMPVNYRGSDGTFKSFSYCKIIDESIPDIFKQRWVKDKIVLIGSTTTGTFDHYPMPFSKHFPGVEFHANVIDNLIVNDSIKQIDYKVTLLLIFTFAIGCAGVLIWSQGFLGSMLIIMAASGYAFAGYLLFAKKNYVIEIVAPLISLISCYIAVLFYSFISEQKEKRWIKKTFGTYVSPAVIDQIIQDPSRLRLGGERKTLTVMFSDIRSFTTMSEGMTPEGVVEILNEYLTKMTEIVFSTGGTLDKFIGDAVMAFWGAPVTQEDHPKRALKCAILMFRELKILQEKWKKEGKSVMDIGIGINTGDMVVGNMGSTERMDYTVIGDNVNLSSRLEGLNKQFGSHIIISESTYEHIKDLVSTAPLGNVKVKGKAKEVTIYKVDENSAIDRL